MPTPTQYFADIAAKYGNVDPKDPKAVERWFIETLSKMPPEQIEAILEELLSRDGHKSTRTDIRKYPAGIPLPTLSTAPHATIPFLAGDWKRFLGRLWRLVSKSEGEDR